MNAKVRLPDREALIVKKDALEVVGFGKNAYLWVGDREGRFVRAVDGAELRALFNAIRRAYTGKTVVENRRRKWPSPKQGGSG